MAGIVYPDKHGIAFGGYRALLPERCSDWPAVKRIRDPALLAAMHYRWDYCQICGRGRGDGVRLEVHHVTAGSKGRTDEATNLIMVCARGERTCHEMVNSRRLPLSTILWALWRTNRFAVDWVRLALLTRHHLPDPTPDARLLAEYRRRQNRFPCDSIGVRTDGD